MKFTNRLRVLISSVIVLSLVVVGMISSSAVQINTEENPAIQAVTITEDTVWANKTVFINESMFFNAKLTIYNATVIFKSNASTEVTLEIGESINITDSVVRAEDPDYNGKIKCTLGDMIYISDSTIENIDFDVNGAEITFLDSIFDNNYEMKFLTLQETSLIARNVFRNNETGLTISYSSIQIVNNTFENLDTGLSITSSPGLLIKGNTFTNIAEVGIYQTKKDVIIQDNDFTNSKYGVKLQQSDATRIIENTFNTLSTAIMTLDSNDILISENSFLDNEFGVDMSETLYSEVSENTFNNNTEIALQILESDYVEVLSNEITESSVGIKINENRATEILFNELDEVDLALDIEHSRTISAIANVITNSQTAVYVEDCSSITLSANDILTSNIGISIWSSESPALSSNIINNTNIGVELILVSQGLLLGNEFSYITTGVYAVDVEETEVVDGIFKNVEDGVKVVESPQFIVSGNTFDEISGDAILFDRSNNSVAYHNNFYDIAGKYGDVTNCIVFYEYEVSNGTIEGNFYNTTETSVLIDTVEYNGKTVQIVDNHPLTESFTVPPAVSVVERDVQDPDDTMIVNVTAQVYKPSDLDIDVYLDYLSTIDEDWNSIKMSVKSSVGQIYIYESSIPKLDYGLEITYRVRITYGAESVVSDNSTYVIDYSDETPIIINEPRVVVRAEGSDKFTYTSTYYEEYYIIVQVKIENQTANLAQLDGRDYVNISWTLYTNEGNETFDNLMFYNATTDLFELELGKFSSNTNITYRIYAEDELGNSRWTLETYEINIISETTEKTGFDSVSLIGITASLFLVQTIVVIQRRKRKDQ